MEIQSLKEILANLCAISSPSGNEYSVISYLKKELSLLVGLDIYEDVLRNLIAVKKGITNKTTMFMAHCDEIGLSVKYIDENGFIRFSSIGGVDLSLLKGSSVTILHEDKLIDGVIGAKPIHLANNSKSIKDIEVGDLWIDIGTNNKEATLSMVSIGDTVSFKSNFTELNNNLISSKCVDNRAGIAVLLSILKDVHQIETDNTIICVFSVQEEIGLRGAVVAGYNYHPNICIVIDVTHATDYPSINKNVHGDIRINFGPVIPIGANVNRNLQNQLRHLADNNTIPYQIESISSNSETELAELQIIKGGCTTGLVSIPCRYMHTPVEVASYDDISNAILLLKKFILYNN